ncbi:MAG: hypothetical protein EXS15_05855 [Phycisphaerales bacterium]|nr:hypothetical protein [Phycisphaerales bacterium]
MNRIAAVVMTGSLCAMAASTLGFASEKNTPRTDVRTEVPPGAPAHAVVRVSTPIARAIDQASVPEHLRESVTAIEINEQLWSAFADHEDVLIEGLPLGPSATHSVVLHRVDPFAHHPVCVGASMDPNGVVTEVPLPLPTLDCYVGSVVNDPDSHVLLSRGDGFLAGYVQAEGKTWVISSGRVGVDGPIIAYAVDELPPGTLEAQPWSCEALLPPGGAEVLGEGGIAGIQPCRQSQIAVDTDVEFLGLFGNNQSAALGYVGTLFAALADIYARDVELRPGAWYVRLWTSGTDPWTGANTSAQLTEFRDYWEVNPGIFWRNSTTLLSGRGLGGGIAWLNSGCGSYAYSVSANLAGSFPYPIVHNSGANWDIMVVAHELGHNYGAPHTHDYAPPADGCGSSPQDCSAADLDIGTIMSYCHICPGGLSNIKLIFHELSKNSIDVYLTVGGCDFSAETQPPVAVPDFVVANGPSAIDIDVLANDLRFNCESVMLLSVGQPSQGGSTVIVQGAGPGGRPIVRLALAPTPPSTLSFSYTVGELSGDTAIATVTVDIVTVRAPENPTGDSAGQRTGYFVLNSPAVLPNFALLTPYASDTLPSVNFDSTSGNFATSGRADQVGAVFFGWLNVPTTGNWTLFTNSDDGSRLLIGDTVVVSNDGLHGMVEKSGTIALGAGKHAIRSEFFENGGGAGMIVSWSGPGTAKSPVPASAWTQGGGVTRADINHDGVVDSLDLSTLLAAWGTSNAQSDINQDGSVDSADLSALLVAWTP